MMVVVMQPWNKSGKGPSETMMTISAEDSLEAKYMVEDASSKKFLVSDFTKLQMIDSDRMEHYNERLVYSESLHNKIKREELTLVELGSHLRIEESLRMQDSDKPKGNNVVGPSVVNMVEHNNSTRLGHVHFKRIQDMSKDGLIPAFDIDTGKLSLMRSLKEVTKRLFNKLEHELRKSKRNRTPKNFGPEFQLYLIEGTRDEVSNQHSYCFNVEDDPKTFDESNESGMLLWKEAINVEDGLHHGQHHLVLADLPPGCKTSWLQLDLQRKLMVDGTMKNSRKLLFRALAKIRSTFLNRELEEEVYMNQPQGFIMPADKCVYSKFFETSKGRFFAIFVDVIAIFGTDQSQVDLTKNYCHLGLPKSETAITGSTLELNLWHSSSACKRSLNEKKLASLRFPLLSKPIVLDIACMIRELITNGVVSIEFVRSQQNLADYLTKGLARDMVIKSAERMRLNGLKHMYLYIIPRMCLEPAEKEDEVVNFLMVNFFEKMLGGSMNKEEPPM
ncbi:hypothetical protein Tco_0226421 [Tanacetum coccineum]